ncbi:MAG: fabG [Gammaproteobacteria bacterium]|jgi:NAD(P)-dependent dehydrogenase (short-subunit alcohol dehydrogenase family)|nr:fabG [Gammaproteobacteria bacterium]
MLLNGKTALVIHGTNNMGQAIALHLQAAGASVFVSSSDRTYCEHDLSFPHLYMDFTNSNIVKKRAKEIENLKIDILVVQTETFLVNSKTNRKKEVLDNFQAFNNMIIKKMTERAWGRIILINNETDIELLLKNKPAFHKTSWGEFDFLQKLAPQVVSEGILINAIASHLLATDDLKEKVTIEQSEKILRKTVMGRFALPEDIARCVTFLASPQNSFLCGEELTLDGGYGSQ